MHLSDLTGEALEHALTQSATGCPRRENALQAIARLAGVRRGVKQEDACDRIDEWVEREINDGGRGTVSENEPRHNALVHGPTFVLASELGVPTHALVLCSDAIDGPASIDLTTDISKMSQVSALREGDGYRFMVPLAQDVYHDGWRLLVRSGVIPATLAIAAVGHSARSIVDHPVLADGRRITAIVADQGGFDVFEMERPTLIPLDEVA